MLDDFFVASAETSGSAERTGKRTNNHVYFGSVDVLRFGDAATGATEDAVGPGFVEDEAELVLELELDLGRWLVEYSCALRDMTRPQTYQLGEVHNISNVLEQALGDDESPRQWLLRLLLDNLAEHTLQIVHVVVFEPSDGTPTDLDALPCRKVKGPVCDNNVSSLAETWNNTAYGGEGLGVDDAGRDAEMRSHVGFRLHVHVLGAVEAWGTARADAVGAQRLDGFLLEEVVGEEVVEVVRGEVHDGAAVGELGLGTRWSAQGELALQSCSSLAVSYPTIMGRFSLSSSSSAVIGATSGSGVQSSTSSSISYCLVSLPAPPHAGTPGLQHTASVSWTFFWVLYLGASKYRTAKRNRNNSTALRTGSFW